MIKFKDLDSFLKTIIILDCIIIGLFILTFLIGFIIGVGGVR